VVEEDIPLSSEDEAALAQSAEDLRLGRFASDEEVEAILGGRRGKRSP
jgi:hypothetical protein